MTAAAGQPAEIAMIGGGRMASALAEGFCRAGLVSPAGIVVFDPVAAAREALAARVPGVRLAGSPAEAAAAADLVWLAVKPQQAAEACGGVTAVMPGKTLVSILAGLSTTTLASLAGTPQVIRVMPNTPCLVGRGVSVVCRTPDVPGPVATRVRELLAAVGHVHEAAESLMNAVTAVSGSGPGFLALVVEGLAAGGERAGLPRQLALALAVQTLAGTGAAARADRRRSGRDPRACLEPRRHHARRPGGAHGAGPARGLDRGGRGRHRPGGGTRPLGEAGGRVAAAGAAVQAASSSRSPRRRPARYRRLAEAGFFDFFLAAFFGVLPVFFAVFFTACFPALAGRLAAFPGAAPPKMRSHPSAYLPVLPTRMTDMLAGSCEAGPAGHHIDDADARRLFLAIARASRQAVGSISSQTFPSRSGSGRRPWPSESDAATTPPSPAAITRSFLRRSSVVTSCRAGIPGGTGSSGVPLSSSRHPAGESMASQTRSPAANPVGRPNCRCQEAPGPAAGGGFQAPVRLIA